jgi:hypothetical protein
MTHVKKKLISKMHPHIARIIIYNRGTSHAMHGKKYVPTSFDWYDTIYTMALKISPPTANTCLSGIDKCLG